MKSDIGAIAITGAVLWGGAVLFVAVANAIRPQYGKEFLRLIGSVYPGYKREGTPAQIAVGTAYAAADGAVCGVLAAWLYRRFAA